MNHVYLLVNGVSNTLLSWQIVTISLYLSLLPLLYLRALTDVLCHDPSGEAVRFFRDWPISTVERP